MVVNLNPQGVARPAVEHVGPHGEDIEIVRAAELGLTAIVVVDSTDRGPALTPCMSAVYGRESQAVDDARAMARSMSWLSAAAGLPFGGGKLIVLRELGRSIGEDELATLGRYIEQRGGHVIAAPGSGLTATELRLMAKGTTHVTGLRRDLAQATAQGVLHGIQAAVRRRLRRDDLEGLRVAIQGLGAVGYSLARLLHNAGARLVVADPRRMLVSCLRDECGAEEASPETVLRLPVDVLAPCARGAVLSPRCIAGMQAPIVAGAALNQLPSDAAGWRLMERGVLFAPDFVIAAGGAMAACAEHYGSLNDAALQQRIGSIGDLLAELFAISEVEQRPPHQVAQALARHRLATHKRDDETMELTPASALQVA